MEDWTRTVLVDMDNTMVDFDGAALTPISPELIVPRTHFYVPQDYPEHMRPAIEAAYNDPAFFEDLQALDGMYEGWQLLIDNGFHPRICTSPQLTNPNAIGGKMTWIKREMVPRFGAHVADETIIDKQKWRHRALAIVDDKPDILRGPDGEDRATWEHILYGWAHLSKVPLSTAAFRLLSWRDTDTLLTTVNQIYEHRVHSLELLGDGRPQ